MRKTPSCLPLCNDEPVNPGTGTGTEAEGVAYDASRRSILGRGVGFGPGGTFGMPLVAGSEHGLGGLFGSSDIFSPSMPNRCLDIIA